MSTEHTIQNVKSDSEQLTDLILRGNEEQVSKLAAQMLERDGEVNELIDTISDAMNIVADLHEVDKYTIQQVESCEKAAEKALDVLRPGIRVEQNQIPGRVMVVSLEGDPHGFDKTLMMTMLEVGGFTSIDGGNDMSPAQIIIKVSESQPDVLVVPLVTEKAAKSLEQTISLMSRKNISPQVIAYGRGAQKMSRDLGKVEEDALQALSRITEVLISRT